MTNPDCPKCHTMDWYDGLDEKTGCPQYHCEFCGKVFVECEDMSAEPGLFEEGEDDVLS